MNAEPEAKQSSLRATELAFESEIAEQNQELHDLAFYLQMQNKNP